MLGGLGAVQELPRSHVSFTEGAQPCMEQLQGTSATSSVWFEGVGTELALDFAIFSSFIYLGAWEHAGAHRGGQPSTCRASADGEGSRWAGAEVPSAQGSPLSPVTLGLMKMS